DTARSPDRRCLENLDEPREARLPSDLCIRRRLRRSETGMTECQARSAGDFFQRVTRCRRRARRPDEMPGVHELAGCIDFEELAFQRVGIVAFADPGGVPAAAG